MAKNAWKIAQHAHIFKTQIFQTSYIFQLGTQSRLLLHIISYYSSNLIYPNISAP